MNTGCLYACIQTIMWLVMTVHRSKVGFMRRHIMSTGDSSIFTVTYKAPLVFITMHVYARFGVSGVREQDLGGPPCPINTHISRYT